MVSNDKSCRGIQRMAGIILVLPILVMLLQVSSLHGNMKDHSLTAKIDFDVPSISEAKYYRMMAAKKKANFSLQVANFSRTFRTVQTDGRVQYLVKKTPIRSVKEPTKPFSSIFTVNANSKTKDRVKIPQKHAPKYLQDLTLEERFIGFNASTIPIVSQLKTKYPTMPFHVIPTDRWANLDNTTCILHSNQALVDKMDHRAPYALILGAQKAGSSALASYLYTHSRIARTRKELHFLSERMDYYNKGGGGIDQKQAREHYLQHLFDALKLPGMKDLQFRPKLHLIDATPTYLAKSDRVPHRVLCLCPWARLIVLLREPISRLFSQYNMDAVHVHERSKNMTGAMREKKCATLGSFDEFVWRDYDTLLTLGVLLPENATDSERDQHYGSAREFKAWKTYTRLGTSMPIGRGLYSIQLRHWMEAYKAANRPMPLLVIHSDDLKNNPENTYARVLDFLSLSRQSPPQGFQEKHKHSYDRMQPMSDDTRAFLQRVFEPYNRQLGEMGLEWSGAWIYSKANEKTQRTMNVLPIAL